MAIGKEKPFGSADGSGCWKSTARRMRPCRGSASKTFHRRRGTVPIFARDCPNFRPSENRTVPFGRYLVGQVANLPLGCGLGRYGQVGNLPHQLRQVGNLPHQLGAVFLEPDAVEPDDRNGRRRGGGQCEL